MSICKLLWTLFSCGSLFSPPAMAQGAVPPTPASISTQTQLTELVARLKKKAEGKSGLGLQAEDVPELAAYTCHQQMTGPWQVMRCDVRRDSPLAGRVVEAFSIQTLGHSGTNSWLELRLSNISLGEMQLALGHGWLPSPVLTVGAHGGSEESGAQSHYWRGKSPSRSLLAEIPAGSSRNCSSPATLIIRLVG